MPTDRPAGWRKGPPNGGEIPAKIFRGVLKVYRLRNDRGLRTAVFLCPALHGIS